MTHIAIFRQPFYDFVLSGRKTIESRWSLHRIAPYNKIKIGDTILIKKTSEKISAKAVVSDVKFFELTPTIVEQIREKYGKEICTDYFDNWEAYLNKKYCTLIWLKEVTQIEPIDSPKSHGAGWIVLK